MFQSRCFVHLGILVLICAMAVVVTTRLAGAANPAFVWPISGYNTLNAYPSAPLNCPTTYQHGWAGYFYDDTSSHQIAWTYSDSYSGSPAWNNIYWQWMFLVDGFSSTNTMRAYPAPYTDWANDWTLWGSQIPGGNHALNYDTSGHNVYVNTGFGKGGSCNQSSDIVLRH